MRSNRAFPLAAAAMLALLLTSCAPVMFGAAASGGVVAANNRTPGAFLEDQGIEIALARELGGALDDNSRYSAVSLNRVVLVVGQAPDRAIRRQIIQAAEGVENVRRVIDEITIGPVISLRRQAEDTLITTKVKTRLLQIQDEGFSSLNVKVLTEDGVVYLMGLDTRENAAIAVEEARKVDGVRHVVKAFEYIASQ